MTDLAAAELLPMVYDELKAIAAARLANEPAGLTLNATAIVHEAYLRLAGDQLFESRAHFFAAAAAAMRRILIDHARGKRAQKRRDRTARSDADPDLVSAVPFDPDRWIDLDSAITRFSAVDADAANLVKLRIFAGLSIEEAGEVLAIPRATAFRTWAYARAWLGAFVSDAQQDE